MELPTRETFFREGSGHVDTVGVTGSNPVSRTILLVQKSGHLLPEATAARLTVAFSDSMDCIALGPHFARDKAHPETQRFMWQ